MVLDGFGCFQMVSAGLLFWELPFGIALKQNLTRFKEKVAILLITRLPSRWKFDSCFWFLKKDKKGIKANL